MNNSQYNTAPYNAAASGGGGPVPPTPPTDVSTSWGTGYSRSVSADSFGSLSYRFTWSPSLTLPYSVEARLTIKQALDLPLPLTVTLPFEVGYSEGITSPFTVQYTLMEKVNRAFSVLYDFDADKVNAPFEVVYSLKVATAFEVTYGLLHKATLPFEVSAKLVSTVNTPFEIATDILDYNPVSAIFRVVYNLENIANIDVTNAIAMVHNGVTIGIQEGNLEQDEGGFNWRGRVTLADVRDYGRFRFNDDVILTVYGEPYNMLLQSKQLNRGGPAEAEARIELLGIAARHDTPIADPITETFGVIGAREAVEQILGTVVDWQIVDWTIPANRLSGDSASPVELASTIVEAAGGLLEANPDGTIKARHRYPVSIVNYPTATPSHIYTEDDSLLSVDEGLSNQQIFNKFRIRDVDDAAFRDRMEFEADEGNGLQGTLYVFPSPYRTVIVRNTGPSTIFLGQASPHEVQLDKEEVIEILDGSGSVQYPINSITSITWMDVNLGGLSFEIGSNTVTATVLGTTPLTRYSLVKVNYKTRARVWRTSAVAPVQVQYLTIDENV